MELIKPERAALLEKSVILARKWKSEFLDISYEELAVEIAVGLASSIDVAQ